MAGSEKRPGTIPATYKGIGANADVGGAVPVGTGRSGPPTVTPTDRATPGGKKPNPKSVGTGANQGGGKSPGRKADQATKGMAKPGKRASGNSNSTSTKRSARGSEI